MRKEATENESLSMHHLSNNILIFKRWLILSALFLIFFSMLSSSVHSVDYVPSDYPELRIISSIPLCHNIAGTSGCLGNETDILSGLGAIGNISYQGYSGMYYNGSEIIIYVMNNSDVGHGSENNATFYFIKYPSMTYDKRINIVMSNDTAGGIYGGGVVDENFTALMQSPTNPQPLLNGNYNTYSNFSRSNDAYNPFLGPQGYAFNQLGNYIYEMFGNSATFGYGKSNVLYKIYNYNYSKISEITTPIFYSSDPLSYGSLVFNANLSVLYNFYYNYGAGYEFSVQTWNYTNSTDSLTRGYIWSFKDQENMNNIQVQYVYGAVYTGDSYIVLAQYLDTSSGTKVYDGFIKISALHYKISSKGNPPATYNISGFQFANHTALDGSACVYDGQNPSEYCTNATYRSVGYQHFDVNDPLGALYLQAYCNAPLIQCQDTCQEMVFSSSPDLVNAGYPQYYSAYCTPANLTGHDTCFQKNSAVCDQNSGGLYYLSCNDWIGSGFLSYAQQACSIGTMCSDNLGGNATCNPVNISNWQQQGYTFSFTPILNSTISYLTPVKPFYNLVITWFGDAISGIIPGIKPISDVTNTLVTIIPNNVNTPFLNVVNAVYNDNYKTQGFTGNTWTSLNCDYNETNILNDATNRSIDYNTNHNTLTYNLSVSSNSQKFYFNLHFLNNSLSADQAFINISDGSATIAQMQIQYLINSSDIVVYQNNVLTGSLYINPLYIFKQVHLEIDYNQPTHTFTYTLYDFPDRTKTDNVLYGSGSGASGGIPVQFILGSTNNSIIYIDNFQQNIRSEYAGYTLVSARPEALQCGFLGNGNHLIRLFSNNANQPIYERYIDIAQIGSDVNLVNVNGTNPNIPEDQAAITHDSCVLTLGAGICGLPAAAKLVITLFWCIGLLLAALILGIIIDPPSIIYFMAVATGLDIFSIITAAVLGFIPTAVIVILLVFTGLALFLFIFKLGHSSSGD